MRRICFLVICVLATIINLPAQTGLGTAYMERRAGERMGEKPAALTASDPRSPLLLQSAQSHFRSSLPNITSGDNSAEHWLASFAGYALSALGKSAA